MKKMTPAQKTKRIQEIKDALYSACETCMEEYEDDIDDADDLEERLRSYSDEWTAVIKNFFTFHQDTSAEVTKPVKAFTLSSVDFRKVKSEVEDSCLSNEGKKAILKAMGAED